MISIEEGTKKYTIDKLFFPSQKAYTMPFSDCRTPAALSGCIRSQ
jgi:hypothetical protein